MCFMKQKETILIDVVRISVRISYTDQNLEQRRTLGVRVLKQIYVVLGVMLQ